MDQRSGGYESPAGFTLALPEIKSTRGSAKSDYINLKPFLKSENK